MASKSKEKQLDLSDILRDKSGINTAFTIFYNHFLLDGHMRILGAVPFFVFCYLRAHYSFDQGWRSFPTWKEFERALGLNYRTVRKAIIELEELQYLDVTWQGDDEKKKPQDYKCIEKIHYRNPKNREQIAGYSWETSKEDSKDQHLFHKLVAYNQEEKMSEATKQKWNLKFHQDFTPIIQKNYYTVVVGDHNKVLNINLEKPDEEAFVMKGLGLQQAMKEYQKVRPQLKTKEQEEDALKDIVKNIIDKE